MKRQCDKNIYIEKDKAFARDGQITLNLPRALNPGEIVEVIISDSETYGYLTYYFKVFAFEACSYDEEGKATSSEITAEVLDFKAGYELRDQGNSLILSCIVNNYDAGSKTLFIDALPTSTSGSMALFDDFNHCTVAFVYKDMGLSSFKGYLL